MLLPPVCASLPTTLLLLLALLLDALSPIPAAAPLQVCKQGCPGAPTTDV
jgi:hypothetical protein